MKKLLLLGAVVFAFGAAAQVKKPPSAEAENPPGTAEPHIRQLIDRGEALHKKDTAQALACFREAEKEARRSGYLYLQAKAAFGIGKVYFQQNLYNRALPNYSRAAGFFEETGTEEERAEALLGLAKSQYYRGNYSRATATFVNVVKQCEKKGLTAVKAEAYEYLGLIYSAFQNFQNNIAFYRKSLQAKKELHDEQGVARLAASVSDAYYKQRRYDSALAYAAQSLAAAEKSGMLTDDYLARLKKATALIHLKNLDAAEKELSFFEPANLPLQDANLRIRHQTVLGSLYAAKHEEALSRRHFDSALAIIARGHAFPELLVIVYEEMAAAYYDRGDLQKAYEAYQKYNRQLSAFYTGDNIVKLANLEGLVILEASKDEIRHLHNDNEFKALALRREKELRAKLLLQNTLKDSLLQKQKQLSEALGRENLYRRDKLADEQKLNASVRTQLALQKQTLANEQGLRTTLLAGLAVVLLCGTLIFFLYRRQRKKGLVIARQAEELQTLMKEIHHRVKNNLQIISSLLDLQSLSIQDKEASEAVKEGKNRVLSMALIHQHLYTEGNVKGIRVKEYIQNLAGSLFDSYNIQKEKIKLVTDIEPLNLDVDTVIPIGLIINELLSNSLKYAFAGREKGEIKLTLKRHLKELQLQIKDNGVGFSPGWTNNTTSFGYKLIKAFSQKLKARLDVYNDNGACVTMSLQKYKMAGR